MQSRFVDAPPCLHPSDPRGTPPRFAATLPAAFAALDAVRPSDYACTRNQLTGTVTRLSPYLTHGMLTLPQVLGAVAAREPLHLRHRFVLELGWRDYFQHVWQHRGAAILESLHAGPLPESAYARELPADLRGACTGVAAIDLAVRTLYADGYLHNHARLWLASYMVHVRKLHWRSGAEWLYGHLQDGDLASNHLSWQWVAGTGSSKPYLFNADNVARFAPVEWHSPGTVIDAPYEAIEAIARGTAAAVVEPEPDAIGSAAAAIEPALSATPPAGLALTAPDAEAVRGRDVWLVHPWALGDPPADLPPGALCVAAFVAETHAAHPWSAARWNFVAGRMAQLAGRRWFGTAAELRQALAGARSVATIANQHLDDAALPPPAQRRPQPLLFPAVPLLCNSFSKWWSRATRGMHRLSDLPGLAGQAP